MKDLIATFPLGFVASVFVAYAYDDGVSEDEMIATYQARFGALSK